MTDLTAIALPLPDATDRTETEILAAQHLLSSRTVSEQAAGIIAESDNSTITAATNALTSQAKAQGSTISQYAEHTVEHPGHR